MTMDSTNMSTKGIFRSPLICRICGDMARGMNFNVITCMSCKAFFRRNALRPVGTLRCSRKLNCIMTKEKRSNCAACRLKKCLAFGMKPQLIHSFARLQPSTFRSLDLLDNDRSTLTFEQWNLLSNIIHAHAEQNLVNHQKSLLDERSSLPIKLRAKPILTINYLRNGLTSMECLFKRSSHFHSLSIDTRQILITHNMSLCASVNGFLTTRTLNLLSDSCFLNSYRELFGYELLTKVLNIHERLDHNDIVIKIFLFVIAFSSNCSHVTLHSFSHRTKTSNSIELIHIQDLFVTLLWKYLVYQCGLHDAILQYSSLIKIVVDMIFIKEKMFRVQVYENMIDTTIERIERILIKDD